MAAAAAAWLLAAAAAEAGGYHAPRTRDGAPDLSGLWSNSSLTQMERPDDFKTLVIPEAEARAYDSKHLGKPPELPDDKVGAADSEWWDTGVGLAHIRGQARTSWIVSPADGQLPFTHEAQLRNKQRRDAHKAAAFANPEELSGSERCLSHDGAGPPLVNGGYDDNFQIVQNRDHIALLAEWMYDLRIIRLGGPPHPPPSVRREMGDSIGHWEGETLVVETTNFTPAEVDAPPGHADADMRVVERLTRTAPGEIFYEFLVHSPATFVQDWRGEMILRATPGPIFEFACHEGNYAMPDMLAGARQPPAPAPHPASP